MNETKPNHQEFLAERLLYAELNRLKDKKEHLDPGTVQFRYTINTIERGHLIFAGSFFSEDYTRVISPFSIIFRNFNGELKASAGASFTMVTYCDAKERALAYFSVIDFMECAGFIPPDSLAMHKEAMLRTAKHPLRIEAVSEYNAFRERSAKDLPYDLSLEVLEFIDWPPMVRREYEPQEVAA